MPSEGLFLEFTGDSFTASAVVVTPALSRGHPVDIHIGRGVDSSYACCMPSDYVSLEDLPWADEQVIRAHAAELIAMAEDLGLTSVRYASDNRLVVTMTDQVERMGPFTFAEEASYHLGYRIRVYSDGVFKNPGVSPDLVAATPLWGVRRWGGSIRAKECSSQLAQPSRGWARAVPEVACGVTTTSCSASPWPICGFGRTCPRRPSGAR